MSGGKRTDIVVLGGGAAGFFAAIAAARENSAARVTILERTDDVLAKVRVSGGGRCNVTHACFDPAELVKHFPRGAQALLGPFNRFQPSDTVEWFESRGVPLKTEDDGRMFPVSDQSQTIIDCLTREAEKSGITVMRNVWVDTLVREMEGYRLTQRSGEIMNADRVILATGSSPLGWEWATALGHAIVPPVPSLFTFTIKDPRLEGLAGVSVPDTTIALADTPLEQRGPLLITHVGLSGPAVLRLSAWGARVFHARNYKSGLTINWLPAIPGEELILQLQRFRAMQTKKVVESHNPFRIPARLWDRLLACAGLKIGTKWTEVSHEKIKDFARELQAGRYAMEGKNPFKEEFVTAGGVALDEVDFRTMESKKSPGLYFAGEILDIDAVTGGFNFQNAWTTGWVAGRSASQA